MVGAALAFAFWAAWPAITTVPSETARRRWEADYQPLLPAGYSDFRADWQSQDTGTRIFSFRCPEMLTGRASVIEIVKRLGGFELYATNGIGAALRRTSDSGRNKIDEYRLAYREKDHRMFALYSNEKLQVHDAMLRQFEAMVDSEQ